MQKKYEETMALVAQMEERLVMAESTLEATLQYQSSQVKAQQSPRFLHRESSPALVIREGVQDLPTRKGSLLSRSFGLTWGEKKKGKVDTSEESTDDE
ncbi:hypothetical protein AQUCO_04600013v1 [Aquilegia coerulea]|uniref:Uncharacterized protein n=1 Tax=Aquilegia coerulea TaxID=218851 RepID=A0A2G5CL65_AQUCA|nr:hypothetical protein AQUCO_04600013v1 [Aquilegia coerulea]